MVTVNCRTCGMEYELVFDHPAESAWRSDECQAEFARTVEKIAAGSTAEEIDLDPDSRLYREAIKDIKARRRREAAERRELREQDYERNRPRPMRPLRRPALERSLESRGAKRHTSSSTAPTLIS
jgi:hypothetical protein